MFVSFLYLVFLTIPSESCNSSVVFDCDPCTQPFLYNNLQCISICPTGSTSTLQDCSLVSAYLLFSVDFSSLVLFNSTSISSFSTLTNTSFNSSTSSMIPTKYQGFYSATNSSLSLIPNYIPAPDFTLKLWLRVLSPGSIFSISPYSLNATYFQLTFENSYYGFELNICSSVNSTCYEYENLYFAGSLQVWEYLVITIEEIAVDALTVSMYLDYVFRNCETLDFSYNAIGIYTSNYYWLLGNPDGGFEGFIYYLEGFNGIDLVDLPFVNPPLCGFNMYWNGVNCLPCDSTCNTWPWCTHSTCNSCYTTSCLDCTGFASSQCIQYSMACTPNCLNCSSGLCTQCEIGYFLYISTCINTSIYRFMEYVIPSAMNSGANPNNYFMYKPSVDDPIPVSGRGIYFNSGSYLETVSPQLFPSSFMIFVWIKGTIGDAISKENAFTINYLGDLSITLIARNSTSYIIQASGELSSDWNYLVYSIEYLDFTTSISKYVNNTVVSIVSYANLYFQDSSICPIVLGKSSSSSFTGFIAQFAISTNMTSAYSLIFDILSPYSSLSPCPFLTLEATCEPCLNTCQYGCINTINCNLCFDSNCVECTNSFQGSCTTCDTDWFKCQGGCHDCPLVGYSGYNCICYPTRGTYCYILANGIACSTCIGNFYKFSTYCVTTCPTGSIPNNNVCTVNTDQIFSLAYNNDLDLSLLQTNSTSLYPDFLNTDPIPTYNRGWYFTSASSLNFENILLSPVIAITMWIKVFSFGEILTKLPGPALEIYQGSTGSIFFGHTTQIESYLFSYKGVEVYSNWRFLAIVSDGHYWLNANDIYIYLEKKTALTSFIVNVFYDELGGGSLVIGFAKNAGFEGFLYSLQIFSIYNPSFDLSSNCNGCSSCQSTGICLSTCNYIEMDDLLCAACLSTCKYSCVRSNDCSLCIDPLCYSCSTFTSDCIQGKNNTQTSNGVLTCKDGFFQNETNDCEVCHTSCATCTGRLDVECVLCVEGWRFYVDYSKCVPSVLCTMLPGGVTSNTSLCNSSSYEVFSSRLESLENTFFDEVSNIQMDCGDSSSFYPDYDEFDPWVTSDRGYYFDGSAYVTSKNILLLGPEFTIGLWARVLTDGVLFEKREINTVYFQLSTSNSSLALELTTWQNTVQISNSFPNFYSIWQLFIIQAEIANYLNLYQGVNSIFSPTLSTDYFADSLTSYLILGGNPGFTGFIWKISIYNIFLPLLFSTNANCVQPIEVLSCLPICEINQFSPNCLFCADQCLNGCNRKNSCILCFDKVCENCENFNTCTNCIQNSTLVDGVCQCDQDKVFDLNEQQCVFCYENCEICIGMQASDCISCANGFYFVHGYCMLCPLGYIIEDFNCIVKDTFAFDLEMNSLVGVFYDSRNGIKIITGNSEKFYPDYDSNDPIAAYLRGFYFDGQVSYLEIPKSTDSAKGLILCPVFSIQIWLLPYTLSGCIISSKSDQILLYSICLSPTSFIFNVNMKDYGKNKLISSSPPILSKWVLLQVTLNFTLSYFGINNVMDSVRVVKGVAYVNYLDGTSALIGCENFQNFYNGFIYKVSVYTDLLKFPARALVAVDCPVKANKTCLPECMIDYYWEGPSYNDCNKCPEECRNGCRGNNTCSLCYDPGCSFCLQYESSECIICTQNAKFANQCNCEQGFFTNDLNQCVSCLSNQYFDNKCINCPDLCSTCNATACYTCIENAELLQNSTCSCIYGYIGKSECTYTNFTATGKVDQSNSIILTFSDQLRTDLTQKNLNITLNFEFTYTLIKWTEETYYIKMTYFGNIPNKAMLTIEFIDFKTIFSIIGGVLRTDTIIFELFASNLIENSDIIVKSEETSGKITTTMTSCSIGAGMINPNPACLWSFISTVQMLCYIELSSIPLPPKFKGYLKGLKKYNIFPNYFEYFVPRSGGEIPFAAAYGFGFTDNLLLFNSGNYLSVALTMTGMLILTFVLSKFTNKKPFSIGFIKKKIEKTLANYKYSAFLRFWITCYLDIMAASLIAIMTTSKYNSGSIENLTVACFLLVISKQLIVILTPVFSFWFNYKNQEQILNANQEISANWGTLFNEFNNDKGLSSSQYYFFYFTRRIIFISIQFFLQSVPIVQLTLNIVLSLTVFFI